MSVQCHCCIGGTNIGEDIRKLDYGQHVVSGTPGRVFGKIVLLHAQSTQVCLDLFHEVIYSRNRGTTLSPVRVQG